jgi:hypothetical protein
MQAKKLTLPQIIFDQVRYFPTLLLTMRASVEMTRGIAKGTQKVFEAEREGVVRARGSWPGYGRPT